MVWLLILGALVALFLYDITQRKHTILRNFPIIGHFRYWFEAVGPELRQYIVTGNDQERPFSRDQRRWIYTSAKKTNSYFGFGTDNDLEGDPNTLIIKHATFPLSIPREGEDDYDPTWPLPCAKIIGAPRGRKHAFRPASLVNVSAMSFGSLSGPAIEAINSGCAESSCLHNTGEGGISVHHRHGGGLIYQMGTGYFGCRNPDGTFSLERLLETVASADVRLIEVKLSQGAKPGLGGVLPGVKVTPEIAAARGVDVGSDCISPNTHSAFSDVSSMLDFVERIADETGIPVGIKSAVGQPDFWVELASTIETTDRSVDFITVDGGEGGTGAAPLVYSDNVALPFKIAMSRVHRAFAERGLHEDIAFIGSGRLGFGHSALLALSLGCDMIGLARESMLAIGCIQAQVCHTSHCPTGVATQNAWLARGLDTTDKSKRLAQYMVALRKDLFCLAHSCGVPHPSLVTHDMLELLDESFGARSIDEVFDHRPEWGLPSAADQAFLRSNGSLTGVS